MASRDTQFEFLNQEECYINIETPFMTLRVPGRKYYKFDGREHFHIDKLNLTGTYVSPLKRKKTFSLFFSRETNFAEYSEIEDVITRDVPISFYDDVGLMCLIDMELCSIIFRYAAKRADAHLANTVRKQFVIEGYRPAFAVTKWWTNRSCINKTCGSTLTYDTYNVYLKYNSELYSKWQQADDKRLLKCTEKVTLTQDQHSTENNI